MRYSPEPGQDQPRGHPFLSPAAYSPHAMPLPWWPAHPPLRGCIYAPMIKHAPRTKWDDCHSPGVPGGSRHEKIINVYVGLVVHQVDFHLYSPSQIHDFIQDIEGNLQAAHNTLKAGGDPGKRGTSCLFVDNLSGIMSIPTDTPYCLVYPTSYVKGIEPDHFDTRNSPAGTRLHHCVCCATLKFSNDDPKQRTQ